jgi:hypothetical protein
MKLKYIMIIEFKLYFFVIFSVMFLLSNNRLFEICSLVRFELRFCVIAKFRRSPVLKLSNT